MIYKNLAIEAGGGIIDHSLQAEQEECASVIIGLGGTGIDCLKEVKRQVYNRIKPDDGSDLPTYRHIRFLAIDSDSEYVREDPSAANIDVDYEYVDIGCHNPAILANPAKLRQNPSMCWVSDGLTVISANSGAGCVRQIGRILFMMNCDKITAAIESKIRAALFGLAGKPLHIHVFTGMCGGTGSGIFLDTCYIIRHILDELRLTEKADVFGYFFLPDVTIEKVPFREARQIFRINGFAAMKELDYCMNFRQNWGEWNQEYSRFSVKTKMPPVDTAFLVSTRDTNGDAIPNGYVNALKMVSNYVVDSLTYPLKPFPAAAPVFQERGACYRYCALGASSLYIPYTEINTYLAAKIFQAYETLPRACHDIEIFLSENDLTYKSLLKELMGPVDSILIDDIDERELFRQVQEISPTDIPPILTPMLQKCSELLERITKNRERMTENTIVRFRRKLIEFCTDSSRGPIYSARLLVNHHFADRDMVAVFAEYFEQNHVNEARERADLDPLERRLEDAFREFKHRSIINCKRRSASYISALSAYLMHRIRLRIYDEMGEFLGAFRSQVSELREEFILPLTYTIEDVAETFKYNLRTLNDYPPFDNEYAIKIVGLDDESIKESLNQVVERFDCTAMVLRFVQHMIDNPRKWKSRDNIQISAMVSGFFAKEFHAYTPKSMDSYVQMKFGFPPAPLPVHNNPYIILFDLLRSKAEPLFWAKGFLDQGGKMGCCFFPNTSVDIQNAANQFYQAEPEIQPISSMVSDRITMHIFYRGIPMFIYRWVDEYYREYKNCTWAGKHLYEKTDEDDRDFGELADIIPQSPIEPE